MQAVGVCQGRPCLLVARFLYRHAHSSKLRRTPLLYRTASPGLHLDTLKLQPPYGLLQVSSSLQDDTQQNNAGTKDVKVKFVLQRRCEFGQQFSVTGDELFGAWAPEAAIPMQWSDGHIWTVELDLSVGTCVEFKVILMAEEQVLEWQPGPNCRLELSGTSSSRVFFVPWSDEEENFTNDAQVDVVTNESLRTQDGGTTAFSAGSLPDLVERTESETHTIKSVDVPKEQMTKESSTNSGMIKAHAKDLLDKRQTEAKGIATGGQKAIDARTSLKSKLKSANFISPFAIPECWKGEEYEDPSDLLSSHDSTESSPVSPEDIAKGQTMGSVLKSTSDDKEENGEKLMLLNRPDEVISEGRASYTRASYTTLTTEFEPITAYEKDEELRVHDVSVEVTSRRTVGTLLSDTELKDITAESCPKHIVQNGSVDVIAETSSETMVSTTVSNNQGHSDKEVMVNNEPSVVIAEVPESENPSMATDLLENVETKPSVTAKEKRWGHKGWSKLWGAFVQGHND